MASKRCLYCNEIGIEHADPDECIAALQSKLDTALGLLREVQNDSGNWLALPLRERIDIAIGDAKCSHSWGSRTVCAKCGMVIPL